MIIGVNLTCQVVPPAHYCKGTHKPRIHTFMLRFSFIHTLSVFFFSALFITIHGKEGLLITPDPGSLDYLKNLAELHTAREPDRGLIEDLSIRAEKDWQNQLTLRMQKTAEKICSLDPETKTRELETLKEVLDAENLAWEKEHSLFTEGLQSRISVLSAPLYDSGVAAASLKTYSDILKERRQILTRSWETLFRRLETASCKRTADSISDFLPKERLVVPVQLALLNFLETIPPEYRRTVFPGH